jgi:hypothetical protein
MGATERRRFITRTDVEDAARAGQAIMVGARDVITDEAAQRARDLDVTVKRAENGSQPPVPRSARGSSTSNGSNRSKQDALRQAVRAAVVAELGRQPAGLDAAIDKVLARRTT